MKHSALVLLLAASVGCFAQNSSNTKSADLDHLLPQSTQAGCPVMFTSANVAAKGRYLPVVAKKDVGNESSSLNLSFRNVSGKLIQSIGLVAELRAKRNLYDLDATTIDVHFTISDVIGAAPSDLSKTFALTAWTVGLGQVRLEQVNYLDGTVWTAKNSDVCSIAGRGATLLTQLK